MYPTTGDPAVVAALDVARSLANAGIPLFLARPATPDDDKHWQKMGFVLPKAWQQYVADPAVADAWSEGMALCAVMGHGLDLLDIDPRSGGQLLAGMAVPKTYALAHTPNGGMHGFIRSLGVGSRDGVFDGVDVKGGMPDGSSRGFAFIAPTVKWSKVFEQWRPYTWAVPPFSDNVHVLYPELDDTGAELAAAVVAAKAASGVKPAAAPLPDDTPEWQRMWSEQKEPHSSAVADRVIAAELAKVRTMPAVGGSGFRTALMRAAMTLGGYVGAGHLDEAAAFDQLRAAVEAVWFNMDADDELWIAQGLADGARRPFAVYAAHDLSAAPGTVNPETERKWQFYDVIGTHPFDPDQDGSDQGLADQVLGRVYTGLRAGVDSGSWLLRGPEVWEEMEDLAAWSVSALARLMPLGRKAGPGEDKGPEHWQHARRALFTSSQGEGKVARKIKSITRGPDHFATIRVSSLDMDPEVLWGGGVPWDLRATGDQPVVAALDPGTPHLHTAAFAPANVPTPAWDAFLAVVWPDPEIRAWALRVLSIALAGYPDAALPVLYGSGRTGKSATVALIARALGTYAHAADPRILAGADNAHASVIYALKGRRLSFVDEGPRKGHLAAERLKQITGGAPLTGNAMRANPITFNPTHTLIMSTNEEPSISDGALRARMRIIPCEGDRDAVRYAREAITPAVWEQEAPGVLFALMRHTAAWLADRGSALTERAPAILQSFAADIANDQDHYGAWLRERTQPDTTGTAGSTLYAAFAAWWEANPAIRRQAIPTLTAWGRAMTSAGYPSEPRGDARYRQLRLTGGGDGTGWVLPDAPAEVLTGSLSGNDGSKADTRKTESPSSTPVLTDTVTGFTGLERPIKENNNNTTHNKKHTENRGETRNPTEPVRDAPSVPPVTSEKTGVSGLVSGSPQPEIPAATPAQLSRTAAAKLKREQAAAAKAAAKAAAVAELAGPIIGLPAAMRRGEEPRSITLSEAASILEAALQRNGGSLSVDIETNALPAWHPDAAARTIQLGDWAEAVDLDASDPAHQQVARAYLAEAREITAFSYTADLAPLARLGVIDYRGALAKAVDVAGLAKLNDPAGTTNGDGLKDKSAEVLGDAACSPSAEAAKDALFKAAGWLSKLKPDSPDDKNGWRHVDKGCTTMIRYALADVLDCAALRIKLPQPDPAVLAREMTAERVVAMAPFHGLALDREAVSGQLSDREPRAAAKLATINQLGVVNPDSPKQVTDRLTALGAVLPRTKPTPSKPEGSPTGKAEVLEKLKAAPAQLGELATTILEYRDDATLLKNMLRPWSRSTLGGDSRTYPTIYTLGADTGRMSCVRPNLQQVSREGGLRECVVADPGFMLVSADFSSVEVRVAAALSQDPTLIDLIINGLDLHTEVAKMVFGPGFTKANRYTIKRAVFCWLFGGGLDTMAAQVGSTVEIMRQVVATIELMAPGLPAWTEHVKANVKAGNTQYPTYSGRVIHLDRRFPHKAPNYLIQGTARELLVDALIKWDAGPYAGGVVLPVHDEIVAMVPTEVADDATAYLVSCMTSDLYGVPITVEADAPSAQWMSAA